MVTDLAAARAARAASVDRRVRELLEGALHALGTEPEGSGVALVAVGGYGRSELSPASDLDVVLLHDPEVSDTVVEHLAEAVWYPLWDDRDVDLDHSVRDTAQMRTTAAEDDRAAMGMLDARAVAGDTAMVLALRSQVLADWRRHARERLVQMRERRTARIERAGALAHSAMPDLKESAGGLRDGVVLRALVATWLVDVPHGEAERLRAGLLDVRDALHEVTGRRSDRFDPAVVPDVAAVLDTDPVALDLHVRDLGRRVEHLSMQAWRRVDDVLRPAHQRRITASGPQVTPLADGVGLLDGEVIVTQAADPARDPEVALRAAAAAARDARPLSHGSAGRLAATLGDLPDPWPTSARRLMVELLSGPGLVPVWDELDFAGVIERFLPEWGDIRLRGSSSPVHRFTVDRHSLETAVDAARQSRDVDRPDLLVVAALLHDIGKGRAGDHSAVGEPMAVEICRRWGFDAADAGLVGRLVRHHLLLPDVATRRDIEDPATAGRVAELVGDEPTLDLLAALTAADARSTSPQAWSGWRRGLIEGLVAKVRGVLDESVVTPPPSDYEGWPRHVPIPDVGVTGASDVTVDVEAHRDGSLLTIVTSSRSGVMAELAGGLALAGLAIRSARTVSLGDAAVSLWEVGGADVDPAALRDRLRAALVGDLDLERRLHLTDPSGDEPLVRLLDSRTRTATVLEVRARDRRGLLWAVCHSIAALGHGIRSAHLSTYGPEARDVFYVLGADGDRLDDDAAAATCDGVRAALTGTT